jgi:hypothetical protein
MSDDTAVGDATGAASFVVSFNIDQLTLGAGVAGLASPLPQFLSRAPAGTQAAAAWLPDLELSQAQTLLDLSSGAFGSYVAVADGDGNQLASAFVFVTAASGQAEGAAGVTLDAPVDLAATPLFGILLSGVKITDLGVTYASQAFAQGDIKLPSGAGGATEPYAAVPSGFSLTVTVDAGGSAQQFALPASGGDGAPGNAQSLQPAVRPLDAPADGPPVSWFAVQKSLGPLFIDRVGVTAASGTLGLALDASLATDVVDIELTGFMVTFNPSAVASAPPAVSLDGLAVSVDAGELQIAGNLTKTETAGTVEYDGALVIGIGSYAIDAAGSYTVVQGSPSLFVFGVAKGEFGGPPAFFVTGLAAGFGVNRALKLPAASQVATFPLIAAAEGTGAGDILGALAQLNTGGWVPPTPGEYWVAAGVTFRSFELIDGVALLTVEFGADLVIALLGMASLKQPSVADAGPPYAYVEITLEAVLRPKEGELSIEALLTPNSYLIDPSCQLTGGIAFDLWFGANEHAGDFVFTAGGYHPQFTVPTWYPSVPRLGFSWHVSDALQVTGDCYFALTPQCVMGGGLLSVTFAAGSLSAWFTAQADFIMYWRPFWIDVDVSISIGVSYTGTIGFISGTFTLELGVSVELWGPPLQGIAHVHWWVISFDVAINGGGRPGQNPATLADWGTFAKTSLPQTTTSPPKVGTVCQARPAGGLQSIVTSTAGETVWVFGGEALGISSETVIPASAVSIGGATAPAMLPGLAVSVYPLGNVQVTSVHQVCVCPWSGATWQPGQALPAGVDVSGWGWAVVGGNLPAALWGPRGSQTGPTLNSTAAVVACVTGAAGTGQPKIPVGITAAASALSLTPDPTRGLVLGTGPGGGPGPAPTGDTRAQVAATIDAAAVAALRTAVVSAANGSGLSAGLATGTLPLLAAEVYAVLTDQPMLGPVGTTGPPAAAAQVSAPVAGAAPATVTPGAAGPSGGVAPGGAVPAKPGTTAAPVLRALFRRSRPGAPTLATVADQWSAARESLLLAAQGTADQGKTVPVGAGTTAVWDLADGAQPALQCDTTVPLWIVALDGLQRPSQALVTGPAGAGPALPAGTRRVAVTARVGPAAPQAAGWYGGTVLRQIGSQALLAEGAVVRPQSPHGVPRHGPRRRRRGGRELGTVTGRELVERTWTRGPAGRTARGWIETYLPSWCLALVVAVAPAPGQDPAGEEAGVDPGPRLTGRYWAAGGSRPAAIPAEAAEIHRTGDVSLWLYLVADPGARPGEQLVVRAWAPEGWRLDGIFGFAARPAVLAGWPPAPAGPQDRDGSASSRVWWE